MDEKAEYTMDRYGKKGDGKTGDKENYWKVLRKGKSIGWDIQQNCFIQCNRIRNKMKKKYIY